VQEQSREHYLWPEKEKMLRRNKKGIQGKQLRLSEDIAAGLFSWPVGVLKKIARIFTLSAEPREVVSPQEPEEPYVVVSPQEPAEPRVVVSLREPEKPYVVVPQKEADNRADRQAFPERYIVFSDTDNDMISVKNTLRFAGILNEKDELTDNLEGICIFHTGDLIDKKSPDPAVVEYWQLLQQDALKKGCHIKLIAGNHEQEVWQKIRAGEEFGMGAKQARWLSEFVESLDLFYVAGPVLFIHGYPTLEFLQTCCTLRRPQEKT